MIKCRKIKAFTILELMVSIFVTITVIASFYKLYEASLKTERTSSIRVSVNLLGEQMLDTIAESMRMIGLNSQKGDLDVTDPDFGIFRQATLAGSVGLSSVSLKYVSPYGSPVTKVSSQPVVDSTFPDGCKSLQLFNSAAFHNNVKKFYFHTQYGIISTNNNSTVALGDNAITVTVNDFETVPAGVSGKNCKDLFPAGTLVTGEDFIYTLNYSKAAGTGSTANSLTLSYTDMNGNDLGKLIDFKYNPEGTNNIYSMPHFVMEFLREREESGVITRTWVSSVAFADISEIIAVRFGFVVLSRKERVYQGSNSPSGDDLPEYCIFDEKTKGGTCYTLPSLNYTASVFRRVVYLANFRLLKDSTKVK